MSEKMELLLEQLVRLQALALTSSAKTQTEAIHLLLRAGLTSAQIAELLGTTPATVRAAKQIANKRTNREGASN